MHVDEQGGENIIGRAKIFNNFTFLNRTYNHRETNVEIILKIFRYNISVQYCLLMN